MKKLRSPSRGKTLEYKIKSSSGKLNSTKQLFYPLTLPLAINFLALGAYYFVKGNEGGGAALGATGAILLSLGYLRKCY